jgi:hypothetical protein
MTAEEYVETARRYLETVGFFEREIARRSDRTAGWCMRFPPTSPGTRRRTRNPFARGINSIQLFHDGTRWWVQTIMWWGETPATPIRARDLRSEPH